MSFLEDIFDAGTSIGRLFYTGVIFAVFAGIALLSVSGMILYGVTSPPARAVPDTASLPSPPDEVEYRVAGDPKPRQGWLYIGPSTAPAIILCHGYRSSRAEIQTLATTLHNNGYSVFLFDFSAHGKSAGRSSLGFGEPKELMEIVKVVTSRPVDPTRVGIWGTDMGAYAAVVAASQDPRIRALVADSAYDDPRQMFDLQVANSGLQAVPLAGTLARWGFVIMNWSSRNEPPLSQRVGQMSNTAKMFIQGRDAPVLAEATLQLFLKSPEPRQQQILPKSNYAAMMDEERRAYETEVVNFFLANLPVVAIPASAPAPGR